MARKHSVAAPSGFTILVVDDQEEILTSTKLLLEREGHQVLTAAGGREALTLFHPGQIQIVIVDYLMPEISGEKVITEIRRRDEEVQILLQTGYSGEKPPVEMLRSLAIQGYHHKTDGPERLLLLVEAALKTHTQLKKMQENEQLRAQSLAREQLKDELVSIVSHELRTPLTSLRGFTELMLQRTFPPEKQRHFLSIIHGEMIRLMNVISNFLDIQRMEAGRQTYQFSNIDLTSFLHGIVDIFSGHSSNHQLRLELPDMLPPIQADADRLHQVLANLLSNAIKYSPHGGEVRIGARQDGSSISMWVTDPGIGISLESQKNLFTKFYRVENKNTQGISGTGLGLALVKEIIEAHKGCVWVESAFGKGSTFFCTLPVAGIATAQSGEESAQGATSLPLAIASESATFL